MREGLKRAVEILDGLQMKYHDKWQAAIKRGDKSAVAHWQAYMSALTVAAGLIEKEQKK